MGTTMPLRIVRQSPWRFQDIAATLCAGSGIVADAVGAGGALVFHLRADPSSRLRWPIPVQVDVATCRSDAVDVPIRWVAGPLAAVLPSFDGTLRAHPDRCGTEFELTGGYNPAKSWDGAATEWFELCLTEVEQRVGHIVKTAVESGGGLACRLCTWVHPPHHCHGLLRWSEGRLACSLGGSDCMYRLAHPLGTAAEQGATPDVA